MKQGYRILLIGLLVILLVLVRMFEHQLFYDPLIDFYRYGGYLSGEIPEIDFIYLLFHLSLRFWLNTLISLLILYVAFFDKNIVKFSALLYSIIFIFGGITFAFFLRNLDQNNVMTLFYIRRFLIHPVFILILLPAFYYYRLQKRPIP